MTHAALAWLGAGLALFLWPAGRAPETAACASLPRSRLAVLGCGLTAAVAVALAGWATGITISVVACPLVLVLVRRLPDGASRPDSTGAMPLVLDLVAAALRAGQPVEAALVLAAPAAGDLSADLLRVAGLLRLGAEPGEAWRPLAARPALAPVAVAASRSSTSGLRLASGFEQVAAEMRAEAHAAAEASAARTGVFVLAPLALCFLPAFVCLGIVPAIVGIGSGVLSTVR